MMVWTVLISFGLVTVSGILGIDLDVGYYVHLVKGQARLIWNQEPIERVLKRSDLPAKTRERLELIQEVREFAEEEIGLTQSKNYTTYSDIGQGPVSWNLIACPKDKLEPIRWTYPVVGSAPYRGFFDRDRAEKEQKALESRGYDTFLRGVSAYSTLGWFQDPILSTMMNYGEGTLADLIIHELTHATIWIEGDVTFNESLASFVGEQGARLFLESRYGSDSEEIASLRGGEVDQKSFSQFLHGIAGQLDSLYAEDITYNEKVEKREVIFAAAKAQFELMTWETNAYRGFLNWKLNNARLALYRTYSEGVDVFGRVYRALDNDLNASIHLFKRCEDAENPETYLDEWLADRNSKNGDP